MKALFWAGVILGVLGILSLVVPLPRNETHGVKVGEAKIAVEVHHSERVSPVVSVILILGGVGTMFAASSRKSA
jgi:predicted MFS family arabinose efflux permease